MKDIYTVDEFPEDLCACYPIDIKSLFEFIDGKSKKFCLTCGTRDKPMIQVTNHFCTGCGKKAWYRDFCCPQAAHGGFFQKLFNFFRTGKVHECIHEEEVIFIIKSQKP